MSGRKFKFRVWDGKKTMLDWSAICQDAFNRNESGMNLMYRIFLQHTDGWVIQQWTGLLDKNGKEIYEGDIVKANVVFPFLTEDKPEYDAGKIKYLNCAWKICQSHIGASFLYHYTCCEGEHEDNNIEVIGNIFENPELHQ